jgi:hypothetical protein
VPLRIARFLDSRLNYLLAVLGICSMLGGVAAYREFSYKLERLAPSAEAEQANFLRQIEIDGQVDDALKRLVTQAGADRAVVWQAHNSQVDINALPFNFLSISAVHVREGVGWEESWSRPVRMSTLGPLLRRMWADLHHPVCVVRPRAEASPMAKARMESRGVELAYHLSALNDQWRPLGPRQSRISTGRDDASARCRGPCAS